MQQPKALVRQIREVIRTQLIPWAGGEASVVLMGAPPRGTGQVGITEREGSILPLQRGIGQEIRVQSWPHENLNALTVPYLGCVVEGEADIVTGTTSAMCRNLKIGGKRWVLHAPQKTFFLAPPQIPISRGGLPHWERPQPENAYSRILWLQFHSTGLHCHFCTTGQGQHWSHPYHFIYSKEFLPLAHSLIGEMSRQGDQYVPVVHHTLSLILHHMMRGLNAGKMANEHEFSSVEPSVRYHSTDGIVQQAIGYIDQRIAERELRVEHIAENLHISQRHLARIFQREMNVGVMEFVITRRMELARQLLIESTFNIRKIASYTGYGSSSSFVKVFQRFHHISPTAYRIKHRTGGSIEQ